MRLLALVVIFSLELFEAYVFNPIRIRTSKVSSFQDSQDRLKKIGIDSSSAYFIELIKDYVDYDFMLKDKDIALKDKDIALLKGELGSANTELMRANGLLTGRGLYEHILKGIFAEEGLSGVFNAAKTCKHVIDNEKSGKLKAKAEKLIANLKKCSYPIQDLYLLFGKLSQDIHGTPWSGPNVRLNTAGLEPSEKCLLEAIADDMGLAMAK